MDVSSPLSKILFDNTSGSSALLDQLTSYITEQSTKEDWRIQVSKAIEFGLKELGQFQIILHFLNGLNDKMKSFSSMEDLTTWVREYDLEWSIVPERWADTLKDILKGDDYTISTHSQSESLKAALYLLSKAGLNLKIYQTQSSPANEGELQANWLVNKGLEVILTTDAIAPAFVEKCDLVILGCDGIYSDGFVNKAGSLGICLAAIEFNKPVYVLADTRKISHNPAPEEALKPSSEITPRSHPNLEVLNLYFEKVPHNLVTGYITEKGILEENI